jgi:hypothetical protein
VINYLLWYGQVDAAVDAIEQRTGEAPGAGPEAELLAAQLFVSALYPDAARSKLTEPAKKSALVMTSPQLQAATVLTDLLAQRDDDNAGAEHALHASALDDSTLALVSAG